LKKNGHWLFLSISKENEDKLENNRKSFKNNTIVINANQCIAYKIGLKKVIECLEEDER